MLRYLVTLSLFGALVSSAYIGNEENVEVQPMLGEEIIKEMFKNLTDKLAEQDPYLLPELKLNFDTEYFKLNAEATDILLRGFSKLELTKIKISPISRKADFAIHAKQIQALVNYYNIDATAVFIPFYGSGTMNLVATGIDVGGSVKITLTGRVKEIKLTFTLQQSNLRISGLLHNEPMSDIVSTAITECVPDFINTYGERLGGLLGDALVDIINNILYPPKPPEPKLAPEPVHKGTFEVGPYGKITYTYTLNF